MSTNAELIAEARGHSARDSSEKWMEAHVGGYPVLCVILADLIRELTDALEASDRRCNVLVAGFKAAYHSEVEEYPDDPDNVAIREALALAGARK